jgi:hypothetical protein
LSPAPLTALEKTAHHEAGHAALVVILGVGVVERACIVGDARLAGSVDVLDADFWALADRGKAERGAVEARALMMLGGDAAETRLTGRRSVIRARCDRRDALMLLRRHSTSSAEARAWFRLLECRAAALVQRRPIWRAIRVLARQLVEHRRLDGARAHAITITALLGESGPS